MLGNVDEEVFVTLHCHLITQILMWCYRLTQKPQICPDESSEEAVPDLGEELAAWATTNSCKRIALNEMLEILRRQGHRLPKDSRTLLQTPKKVATVEKCGGHYAYFGIASGILKFCLSVQESLSTYICALTLMVCPFLNPPTCKCGPYSVTFMTLLLSLWPSTVELLNQIQWKST